MTGLLLRLLPTVRFVPVFVVAAEGGLLGVDMMVDDDDDDDDDDPSVRTIVRLPACNDCTEELKCSIFYVCCMKQSKTRSCSLPNSFCKD